MLLADLAQETQTEMLQGEVANPWVTCLCVANRGVERKWDLIAALAPPTTEKIEHEAARLVEGWGCRRAG